MRYMNMQNTQTGAIPDIDPDAFDQELQRVSETPRRKRLSRFALDNLIIRSDVARKLLEGASVAEIAKSLDLPASLVRKFMKRIEFADLLEIEARRAMEHLSKRDLKKEKYLNIVQAISTMIRDSRLLRNEPTEIHGQITHTTIESITLGLFGTRGRGKGQGANSAIAENERTAIQGLPESDGSQSEKGSQ